MRLQQELLEQERLEQELIDINMKRFNCFVYFNVENQINCYTYLVVEVR